MKFKKSVVEDTKKEISRVVGNINSDAHSALRVKRDEIENMSLFQRQAAKLTPEEVKRASDVGLLIGGVFVLLTIVGIGIAIWWWFV